MNHAEFGKLLSALRKEKKDEDDLQLTQAKLGEITKIKEYDAKTKKFIETSLGELVIGKIERGELSNLDPQYLLAIAKALNLTSRERKEFFYAAITLDVEQASRNTIFSKETEEASKKIYKELLQMMEKLQLPAFIIDSYADVLAGNEMLLKLLEVPEAMFLNMYFVPAGKNMLRVLFDDASNHSKLIGDAFPDYSMKVLRFIRAISLRYRASDYWQNNIFKGAKKFKLFQKYWNNLPYEEDDHYIDSTLFKYVHPKAEYGLLMYFYTTVQAVTEHGELYFLTYIPADPHTADVFNQLYKKYGSRIVKISDWPDKKKQ
jgi:hypothetical protein